MRTRIKGQLVEKVWKRRAAPLVTPHAYENTAKGRLTAGVGKESICALVLMWAGFFFFRAIAQVRVWQQRKGGTNKQRRVPAHGVQDGPQDGSVCESAPGRIAGQPPPALVAHHGTASAASSGVVTPCSGATAQTTCV